jgi:hypothetical protein
MEGHHRPGLHVASHLSKIGPDRIIEERRFQASNNLTGSPDIDRGLTLTEQIVCHCCETYNMVQVHMSDQNIPDFSLSFQIQYSRNGTRVDQQGFIEKVARQVMPWDLTSRASNDLEIHLFPFW